MILGEKVPWRLQVHHMIRENFVETCQNTYGREQNFQKGCFIDCK